ncbi:MAG: AMMECR1 domain-containing protein, partial [Erysipelotrichaceae bacterium]|nr:AMMECR1 domain-containing protein [Erysipelotrichaceae bacterium]
PELKDLDISVDILTKPEKISDKQKLDVQRFGVIVVSGTRRGLLLPDLEGIDSVEQQISIARRKAGIESDEAVELYRFEVVRHHD